MTTSAVDDPLPEAVGLIQGATRAGLPLRILGGLGVRVLCPAFPPRLRAGQDMDFACGGKRRKDVASYLEQSGCQPDKRFNNLNGDRQMYFTAPSGRPIDVMVDRLICATRSTCALAKEQLADLGRLRPAAVEAADRGAEPQGRPRHRSAAAGVHSRARRGGPLSTRRGSARCSRATGAGGARHRQPEEGPVAD